MNKTLLFKGIALLKIFIANLILILISNFIARDLLGLLIKEFNNSLIFIIIINIILAIIFSFVNIILYIINYKLIGLFFLDRNFYRDIKAIEFLNIIGTVCLIGSFISLIVFIIANSIYSKDIIMNSWDYIANIINGISSIIGLILFGIYISKKIKEKTLTTCIFISLIPYTVFNLIIYSVKFYLRG